MSTYSVSTETGRQQWDDFVERCPEATSYHRYSWREVIERSFHHEAHYLAARDAQGMIQGVLPLVHMKSTLFGNFLVSVPFVSYGGLLSRDAAAQEALLAEAARLRLTLKADYVELRHLARGLPGLPSREHKVTMVLPLAPDESSQWASFDAKLRNQIRKAEKNELSCVQGHGELLDDFYAIFARNMRDLGTPVYGKELFANLLAAFSETTRLFVVRYQGKSIAAGIASWYRQVLEVPWASSVADYKPLCPNNLLYWECIRFALEHGFASFDFGRSTRYEGTFHYKKQWGAEPVPLYWQYLLDPGAPLPALDPSNPRYHLAIKLWKRLPLGLTTFFGPRIVRNIP